MEENANNHCGVMTYPEHAAEVEAEYLRTQETRQQLLTNPYQGWLWLTLNDYFMSSTIFLNPQYHDSS
ncbi:MAG: hypothetical protein WC505_06295 [Patescibacteria group bacterium]